MTDHSPTDPILAHVEPVPGGLYGDLPYEAALADLRSAVAEVSAALRDAGGARAEQLIRYHSPSATRPGGRPSGRQRTRAPSRWE
ncbi:hypothetical protein SAM23877_6504 [Streptomyces ambofaciens ATCC 23877]|uniref:Uncharacterized protein n=1 Tax=Streptomyces ambofaciens (strain ATCC 23877 / 3486 / DSM 40053 / JCM 4204 / NBRC 12836 / NRRL B-2516) TaxID=278992 RepID=A0AE68_STRA7|nr:hypothetical protein [Streptomyces ambofaciens]AKZ59549.1 hypothetical protein SAM23877_6504 [Streptomyces ambofaciens ATCC 23877]CAJ88777.1 hypothetical protein SAMR1068 [Streptomyces ambofaciens ATCC 23877]